MGLSLAQFHAVMHKLHNHLVLHTDRHKVSYITCGITVHRQATGLITELSLQSSIGDSEVEVALS